MSDSADDQQFRATQRAMRKMRKWTPEQWEAQRRAVLEALEKKRVAVRVPAPNLRGQSTQGIVE